MAVHILSAVVLTYCLAFAQGTATDIELDAKAQLAHRLDSLNLLLYTFLLTLTVLTIWLFKHRRLRFLHETGLAVIYGLIVGALIRYTGSTTPLLHIPVVPENSSQLHQLSLPPDTLWLKFPVKGASNINKTYGYRFRGEIVDLENNEIDLKATFDPEIFFNIILPPIIFHAGYSLKRKYFFKNLGAILTFALIGTTISSFVIGTLMYVFLQLVPNLKSGFTFLDSLYFGALISPTDPLTILAIFNDLKVDVNLYALVFGESVLNDAVAIVLSGAIQNYGERYQSGTGGFEANAFLLAVGDFIGIFSLSLFIGAIMGCLTAFLTKFTRVRDFPLLESALFVLMSYSTFLIAEASDLTGVVAVLFCGMCQAHYTYNNLSSDSILPPIIFHAGYSLKRGTVGVDEETEALPTYREPRESEPYEKALMARIWSRFDSHYMKPLLTHARPSLMETLPGCCNPLARLLTTTEQITQEHRNKEDSGSEEGGDDEADSRKGCIQTSRVSNRNGSGTSNNYNNVVYI
ncbi:sodium/hydrogen exchanger 6 [Diaphorina citri]|uniref:Sodium/hydrogen exchanger 6 n=1 Tax=Diaphorina citri TaxID=121845 RepID=A0A3Q0ILX0_DIACI|nr:sodium/hydrogen exchanger 6 [Diaphorina citri]